MLGLDFRIPPITIDLHIDTESLLDDAASMLLQKNLNRFLHEVSPDNVKWLPSKAALLRKMKGIAGGTLYDTGTLFRSLSTVDAGDDSRSIGTNVPYAAQHQGGLMIWPERQFLGVSEHDDFLALRGLMESRFGYYLK